MDTPDKPPTPEPPDTGRGAYLPPKLREKLEATDQGGDDWEPRGSSPLPWIIISALILAGGVWGFMTVRSGTAKRKAAEEARVAQARADSLAAAVTADSLRALLQDSTATSTVASSTGGAASSGSSSSTAPSASRPAAGGSSPGGASVAEASKPKAPSGPYGLAVATYLFEDRAQSEKERLATSTGLTGRVVTATEDGTTVYRLILGSFDSRATAQKKAEELTGQNLVREAKVVPLSRS